MMNRRDFLKTSSAAAGSWVVGMLPTVPALAQDPRADLKPILIHMNMSGGGASLIGLNPLLVANLRGRSIDPIADNPNEFYQVYRDDELRKVGNHLLGVGATPLLPIASDLSIVNGVMMLSDQPAHTANTDFMLSGEPFGKADEFVIQLQRELDPSLFGIALSDSSRPKLTAASSIMITDLSGQVTKSDLKKKFVRHATLTKQETGIEEVKAQLQQVDDLKTRMEQTRQQYIPQGSNNDNFLSVLPGLEAGFVNYAFLNYRPRMGTLDTHQNHMNGHRASIDDCFRVFADLVQTLKKIPSGNGTLYDRSIVILTTEFSRSSWRQGTDGADDNPFNNSVLLSGGAIRNNINLGQSTVYPAIRVGAGLSRLQALPFDFGRQQPISYKESLDFVDYTTNKNPIRENETQREVDYIFPQNILRTLAEAMGVNPARHLLAYRPLTELMKRS